MPTGAHPSGQFGPAYQTVAVPCRRRYQEGSPDGMAITCATCTMDSIGACADCGDRQCGNCGLQGVGIFICRACQRKRDAARAAEAAEAAAEAERQRKRLQDLTARREKAVRAWLKGAARTLDGKAKPTHKAGWAVGKVIVKTTHHSSSGGYRDSGRSWSTYDESQLVLLTVGSLVTNQRSKPKSSSLFWSRRFDTPASTSESGLVDIAGYVKAQYGIELPPYVAPGFSE